MVGPWWGVMVCSAVTACNILCITGVHAMYHISCLSYDAFADAHKGDEELVAMTKT
jgi:hypothetical protein